MLAKLEMIIKTKNGDRLNYNISSILHGIIMENISHEYAEKLHMQGYKPFSQSLVLNDEKALWTITTLNEEAKTNIIDELIKDSFGSFYMKKKDATVTIESKKLEITSYNALMENYYFGNCSRYINIIFNTPCAFKSDGNYVFMPNTKFIFKSLIKKYDAFSKEFNIGVENVIEDFEKNIRIEHYNLKSTKFHLEGIKIPSFRGEITFKVNGPQTLVNLVTMLVRFGEYSNIGIKAAIGMGSLKVITKNKGGYSWNNKK